MKSMVAFFLIGLSGCLASTEWDNPNDPESENFSMPFEIDMVPEDGRVADARLPLVIVMDNAEHKSPLPDFRCSLNDQPCVIAVSPTNLVTTGTVQASQLLVVQTLGLQVLRLQPVYQGYLAQDIREVSWTRVTVDTNVSFQPNPYGGLIGYQCAVDPGTYLDSDSSCIFFCSLDDGPFAECATMIEGPPLSNDPNVIWAVDLFPSVTTTHVLSVAASVEGARDPTPATITIDCFQYGPKSYDFECSGPGDEPFSTLH